MRPPTERTRTDSERAFTLIELLLTVVILGVIMAIAIPTSSMSDERKLDILEVQIQDALDYAKDLSYRLGSKHAVMFNTQGQYFAVVNEQIVPMEDPLRRQPYIIRMNFPDQPAGIRIEQALFGSRSVAPFDEKGVLTTPGTVRISAGDSQRWFEITTATAELAEVPITTS